MCNYVKTHTHTRKQKPGFVHAHRTEGVTGTEGWERAYGVGGNIKVGGGNADGNEVGVENWGVNGDEDRTGAGTRTGAETC